MSRRLDISRVVFAGFSILYPLIVVIMIRALGPGATLLVVVMMVGARSLLPALRGVPAGMTVSPLLVLAAIIAVGVFDRQFSVRLYPVFMSLAMLAAFAETLWHPPSMIERFARISEPDLPPGGVRYTRNVTLVWVVFFALNSAVALWSVLQRGWTAWLVYNGFISYAAVGTLLGGEYVVRQFVRRAS